MLNRLLYCSLWQFSGALFYFLGLFLAFRGQNRPEPPCNFFLWLFPPKQLHLPSEMILILEVGALWCSGSCSRLAIRGSWVLIPLGAYALRQGILSTIVSLDPGVVNEWVSSRNFFLRMLSVLKGCIRAKAGVIMPWAHRDAIWMWYALYKNGTLLFIIIWQQGVYLLTFLF